MTRRLAFGHLLLLAHPLFARGETPVAKPTVWLIGDSTVKNGQDGFTGWGSVVGPFFDPAKATVENRALGGRSSRSYLREGLWGKVEAELKPGDFVIMQFGHNDNGPLDDAKARAPLKGNGDETKDIVRKEGRGKETVRSFGWYLRKYIAETKAKGATPVVCSLIPRDIWKEGKVVRSVNSHAQWAKEAAEQGGAHFVDLNSLVADRYDALGREKVHAAFFTEKDHTHTNKAGAELNAECVAEGLQKLPGGAMGALLR
jgi:lysophospholipase L1-like esterase